MDSPVSITDNPINLRSVARHVRDNLPNANRVERFQNLFQETVAQCLSDTHEEVLSDDDWIKSDWSDL